MSNVGVFEVPKAESRKGISVKIVLTIRTQSILLLFYWIGKQAATKSTWTLSVWAAFTSPTLSLQIGAVLNITI